MAGPIDISVRADVKAISRKLSALAQNQLRFATAQALTELAKEVKADEAKNMDRTFRSPRRFTINSLGVQGARKDMLTAKVYVKPIAAKYLTPYEDGGSHVLPGTSKAILNPKNIRLDKNGQLPRKALERLKARKDVYIGPVKSKSGEVNGVWQRIPAKKGRATHLKLLIRFGDALPVNKRLNYRSHAQALVSRRFNAVFGAALARAMATAR
ncbi:hypothetical protein SAMN04244572_03137 [Azotobacter beijerinckii]|uniref:Uncharacterized protein n=1 Tax=Azotobacter beijerinckii TaxID=170623 RepID=A0A1H6WZV4_9GAMM|nr:hypothetical protein [Azotobacter beijerinckii]SEJ21416.1 hypothetical protein SAMN04244572_03137 [Azotobacter beijerinckii]